MKKVTAQAHANIAFVKYWGKQDEVLRLPTNASISMNLSNLHTTTTVEFIPELGADDITIDGEKNPHNESRVIQHLDRIRARAHIDTKAKIVSQNNFPTGVGLSSSASGFAALTYAAVTALGISLSERELSILARQGSGSACRSIPDGFVEWKDARTSSESYAQSLFPPEYWDLVDIVALTSTKQKYVPTSQGQQRVQTSLFFKERLSHINDKITLCKKYLAEKNFSTLGKLSEMEALEMHAIMITSWPALLYWLPETLTVMQTIQQGRNQGLEAYFTMNTGQNVHILCQKKDKEKTKQLLATLPCIQTIIENHASKGSYLIAEHLF